MARSVIVHQSTAAAATGLFLHTPGHGFNVAELATEYAATHDCTFSNLRGHVTAGGSGTNTLQFRKNGTNGTLVASGTGAAALTPDTTHTDSLVAGDVFTLQTTDTGTDPQYRHVTLNVDFDGPTGTYFRCSSSTATTFDLASTTRFIPIQGLMQADGTATEVNAQIKVRGYSKADAFQVRVDTNARTTDTVLNLRVNGSDVAASTVTIGAGLTGLFMANGINQALADGDLLCASIVYGTGTEALTLNFIGATLLSDTDATEVWAVNPAGVARTASATPDYYVLGGTVFARSTTTGTQIVPGFAADSANLRLFLAANTYSVDATLKLFVDGVDSGVTTTITAAATGWLENAVDIQTITSANAICAEVVGGGTGSITITAIGLTLDTPSVVNPSVVSTGRRLSGGGMGPGARMRVSAWPVFSRIEHD
jgi:hypothetical protein